MLSTWVTQSFILAELSVGDASFAMSVLCSFEFNFISLVKWWFPSPFHLLQSSKFCPEKVYWQFSYDMQLQTVIFIFLSYWKFKSLLWHFFQNIQVLSYCILLLVNVNCLVCFSNVPNDVFEEVTIWLKKITKKMNQTGFNTEIFGMPLVEGIRSLKTFHSKEQFFLNGSFIAAINSDFCLYCLSFWKNIQTCQMISFQMVTESQSTFCQLLEHDVKKISNRPTFSITEVWFSYQV